GLSARLTGAAMAVVAVPVFRFGRYLIMEHSVSPRRWKDDGDGPNPPLELPPPPSPTLQERHVAARRSPRRRPMSARPGDRRSPGVKTGA
ncbi:MAG: hypothetical protein OEM39_09725, partial [Acidimicrobiia bacterium]|nr:hypothetical protein [Acidimicrobiia bacterium]